MGSACRSLAAERRESGGDAIARALDVREIGEAPVIESLQQTLVSRELLLILDNFEHLPTSPLDLTAREREVVVLVANGMTNRQIAERLVVGNRTVDSHVRSALGKLGFRSRFQLADWALEHGLAARSAQPHTARTRR